MRELAPMDNEEEIETYNAKLYAAQHEAGELRGKMEDIHRFAGTLIDVLNSGAELDEFYDLFAERISDIHVLSNKQVNKSGG